MCTPTDVEHAENVPDEDYVKRAIKLGASQLWFTDHGPFPAPGDQLAMIRMKYSQLEEYIESIERLREAYKGEISLHCGLELEYLPTFDEMGYYKKLQEDPRLGDPSFLVAFCRRKGKSRKL